MHGGRASTPIWRRSALRLAALAVLSIIVAPLPAEAHRAGSGRTDGLPISSLSHGQMAVIAHNRAAVFALAAATPETDETFRRLFNYAKIQRTVCLWGLIPGSVSDEQNPFNGCAHAYLAATRALLDDMRERPNADPAAAALAAKIDRELLMEGTLELCVYSGQPYNTADLIFPDWAAIPTYPPSALAGGGMLALIGAGSLAAWRRRRVSGRD